MDFSIDNIFKDDSFKESFILKTKPTEEEVIEEEQVTN